MERTSEEVVTKLLSNNEILNRDYAEELFEDNNSYATNPKYDLSGYLKNITPEPNRFGDRYIFIRGKY